VRYPASGVEGSHAQLIFLKHLFFDLDGTLTHPHEGITRCIQHALVAAGVEPPSASDLVQYVGPPLRDTFTTLLATTDDVRLDAALAAYRVRYEASGILENSVCEGIPAALDALRRDRRHLSVVTSKPAVFARRVLDHFGLAGFFTGIHGPDLATRRYSKRSLIRAALDANGFVPTRRP
jgi:phosphoglycolate phosphatase